MKKLGLALGILVVSAVGLAIAARPGVSPSPEEHAVAPGSLSKSATGAASSGETVTKAAPAPAANAMAAIDRAARAKKYLFVFFWKDELEPTLALRTVFEAAMAKVSDRADALAVRVTDPAEKEVVARFMLDRAPMPLVLALAPNGAEAEFPRVHGLPPGVVPSRSLRRNDRRRRDDQPRSIPGADAAH